MALEGPKITKVGGGLGRRNPTLDSTFALIGGGIAATGLALDTVAKLESVEDAETLGIDASYDSTNRVLWHYHISEFFRLAPNGTLYIMIVAQGTSLTDMCDTANSYLKKLLTDPLTNKEIRVAGVVLNRLATYVGTTTDGIDADVIAAVPKAQELVDELRAEHVYIDTVIVEGLGVVGPNAAAMHDFRAEASENVAVVITADFGVVSLDSLYRATTAVGSALGGLAARQVNEDLGSVTIQTLPDDRLGEENFTLTDSTLGRFESVLYMGGVVTGYDPTISELITLTAKGYIFVANYQGYPGFYFNSGPTCTELASDFAYISDNRTWNKFARLVREALIPRMNSSVIVDGTTGYIAASTIASWQAAAIKKAGQMAVDGEISQEPEIFIDPKQNVLSTGKVVVKGSIVPTGTARVIEAQLGFENPFS